jgi:uncharacterized membrane protein
VAFIYVGVIWLNHHHLFERLRRVIVHPYAAVSEALP